MAKNKVKKESEITIEQIENINLSDIKEFFNRGIYANITEKYSINTLGDLIRKTTNGELFEIISSLPISNEEKNKQYKEVIGSVTLLMCKYFNQDPKLNKDDNIRDIKYQLVLDDLSVDRLELFGITKLEQLLDMVKNNDYSILYLQWGLGRIVSNRLVKKLQVIYNYLVSNDKEVNNQNFEIIPDVTFDNICDRYNELKRLITELNSNREEINKIQIIINEKEKENNGNNREKFDYNVVNNTSILEVKNFFSTSNFEFLVKNEFLTLGDLFDNNFPKELMNNDDRPYNERLKIIATVKILKCKYLGEDPKISTKISYKVFENLLGISFKTQMSLYNKMGINNLTELLQLIENKDFSKLNQIESEDLIPKLVVLYNFNKLDNVRNNNNNNDKLLDLYKLLKELVIQNNLLIESINEIQSCLNQSLQKVKCL